MNEALELMARFLAAHDLLQGTFPTWKERREAELACRDIRNEVERFLQESAEVSDRPS